MDGTKGTGGKERMQSSCHSTQREKKAKQVQHVSNSR